MGRDAEGTVIPLPKILLAMAIGIVVVAAVVWAIVVVGTPQTARNRRIDQARVDDLQRIHWSIDRFYELHDALPTGLDQLDVEERNLQDPVTGDAYGYQIVDAGSYKLSASFECAAKHGDRYSYSENWDHPAGLHEFSFKLAAKEVVD